MSGGLRAISVVDDEGCCLDLPWRLAEQLEGLGSDVKMAGGWR
jgi:hypothetical protein